jgi:bifunctional non-homologous end joining protein LigD
MTLRLRGELPVEGPIDLEIDGRTVRVTHPDRVIWPATGTTKRDLIDYLMAVSVPLLAHLRRRATMLWRFPEGVEGPGWFQAQCRSAPPWVETFEVNGRGGDILRYCVIEEPATLAWLANLGTIELHPHGWTVDRPDNPTHVVFDLDPGPPAGLRAAAVIALTIADRLQAVGLAPVAKTSGVLGLHVAAPLDEDATFDRWKAFSRDLADELAARAPDEVVARSDRRARAGRVFIDWVQNDSRRQLVAPYSPRATSIPQVSTPLSWAEVARAADGDLVTHRPSFADVPDRVRRYGDLWAGDDARGADRGPPRRA